MRDVTQELSKNFRNAGYELYLVGGSVRDDLLGIRSKDLDFATSAPVIATSEILKGMGNYIYDIGQTFGTARTTIDGTNVEITTYRQEEYGDTRKPTVTFSGVTLLDDLSRRDFTINAMAMDLSTGEIIDPFEGANDLISNRLVRAVGNPDDRFAEDPLRLLRAIRFASRYNFDIEAGTWRSMVNSAPQLSRISIERIQEEYTKILLTDHPSDGIRKILESNIAKFSVPELQILRDRREQGQYHTKNLLEHTFDALNYIRPDIILRWAALLHDIGKPQSRTEDESGVHFYGHELHSAEIAEKILRRLKYSNEIVDRVCRLVANHMRFNFYTPQWSDGAARRLVLDLGEDISLAFELSRSDIKAHKRGRTNPLDHLESRIPKLFEKPIVSPLDGIELMDHFNRKPGPWIRVIKDRLVEEVIEGKIAPDDKKSAFALAEAIILRWQKS